MDEIKAYFKQLKRRVKRKVNKSKKKKNQQTNAKKRPQPHTKKNPSELRKRKPIAKPTKNEDRKVRPNTLSETANKTEPSKKRKKKKRLTKEEFLKLKKKKRKESILEVVKFLFPVVLFAVFIFFFILNTSPHRVDGNSMLPTLENGDKVIVRRTKEPKRYEVITFKPPVESKYQYVKRVIGMPGDLIWTEEDYLFINHQAESLPKASELSAASELPDGTIKINISEEALDQLSELKEIPSGHYFVLGDNRNNSSDSRRFGLVDGNAIEGVVSFRYGPSNQIGWIK